MNNYLCAKCKDRNLILECACGCGQLLFKIDKWGKVRRFVYKHNMRGVNNHRFKGSYIDAEGYRRVYCPEHPFAVDNHVKEHRLVMEERLGRYLDPSELVHHKDNNKLNNDISNLELLSDRKEHNLIHNIGHYSANERRKDMSIRLCKICTSNKTHTSNKGHQKWFGSEEIGFTCHTCYYRRKRNT